jgi:hypothetical protein
MGQSLHLAEELSRPTEVLCCTTLLYKVLSLVPQFEDSVQAVVDNQHLSGSPPPASKSKPAQVGIDRHIIWHVANWVHRATLLPVHSLLAAIVPG